MLLKIFKNRTVSSSGTWGTKNENNYEILNFEFPEELEEYNKRIVYYLGNQKVWDPIIDNKAILTNAITTKGSVKAYIWCTKSDEAFETDVDFRTQIFVMNFFENENADGIVPTPEQVDGFNTMLTEMNEKIEEIDELETTIENAETQRKENEETRQNNENTRQENEQTRQEQEADRERRTDEAIGEIEDLTEEYNQNAQQKTNEFNSNYTQKVNDFNSNATTQKTDFNSNASSKTSAFNSNAETKTNAFNTNATNKTNAFNSNATSKTTDFNANAENKTSAFNTNASDKTTNFNNNASKKTDEFNTNAQDKIDEYDEHIVEYQAQIDELQEEVDELSENMPWDTTEQATEIQVTDAAKYSKNKLELFGNTSQDGTSGSQAIDYSEVINKKVDFSDVTLLISTTNFNIKADTTYYIRWIFTDDTYVDASSTLDNIRLYNGTSIQKQFGGTNIVLTSQELDGITSVQVRNTATFASTYAGKTIKALVFSSDSNKITPDTYEPYTGGFPSPSPDYPQDIHVVTGNNTIHVNNTDYPINLGSLELCKIGDYQDYIYKENGNWYKYGAIGKLTLTGNENINSVSFGTNSYTLNVPLTHFMIVNNSIILVLSNKYKGIPANNRTQEISNSIYQVNNQSQITFRNTRFVSVEDFKTNNIGTIIYLILKTPTSIQITDSTLISQLEAIYNHLALVKGTNNITVTAEDLAPYMELTYMQDLKSKLDNLDSRLSLLE